MHTTTTKQYGIHEAFVIREDASFVTAELTIDVRAPHTLESEALRFVFTEALQAGCGSYTREAFIHAQSILGTTIRVTAHDTFVQVSIRARNAVLSKVIALVKDMLTHPTFTPSELKRIKQHLTNILKLSKEDARPRAHEQFVNLLVSENDWRYSFDTDELIAAIGNVQVKNLKLFHKSIFTGVWIATYGGTEKDSKKVAAAYRALHAGRGSGDTLQYIGTVREIEKKTLSLIDIPSKQNIEFSIGAPLPIFRDHPDFPALVFGISVLGLYGGFSGRLMSTVREKEGLTYMIYARIEDVTKHDEGYWRIATFFTPQEAVRGITATILEITTLRDNGITHDELKRFKAILKTRATLIRDSLSKTVQEIHSRQQVDETEAEHEALLEKIHSLTTAHVNTVLKKYINPNSLIISGAGPTKSVESVLKKLTV